MRLPYDPRNLQSCWARLKCQFLPLVAFLVVWFPFGIKIGSFKGSLDSSTFSFFRNVHVAGIIMRTCWLAKNLNYWCFSLPNWRCFSRNLRLDWYAWILFDKQKNKAVKRTEMHFKCDITLVQQWCFSFCHPTKYHLHVSLTFNSH